MESTKTKKEISFSPIEQLLNKRKKQHKKSTIPLPYQQILLTRLCMHVQGKLLEIRNNMLKKQGINETLFMALIILDIQKTQSIQPSELSDALGSSRTNATRIADELENHKWIERKESHNDRRCLHLHLTENGSNFLKKILPLQTENLEKIWSVFTVEEKNIIEKLMRKLLVNLNELDN
ncbi:MAG: transcriptional repressor MprA [Arsenophonus sp. NEOnobi-MAG3]